MTAGALAIAFWPENQGMTRLAYAGPSADGSGAATFQFTNSSRNKLYYTIGTQIAPYRDLPTFHQPMGRPVRTISGRSATNFNHEVSKIYVRSDSARPATFTVTDFTNQWRLVVQYAEHTNNSWMTEKRLQMATSADKHSLPTLGRWLRPASLWRFTFGPSMLGLKPAAETER